MTSPILYIHEIFPSFQGEGILLGVPQVFLRLGGCNLSCCYCDTPAARDRVAEFQVIDWHERSESFSNPADISHTARCVLSLNHPPVHSVSVTGGEPLLQAEGLARLLPLLAGEGMRIYLETNGTLPDELEMVIPWMDWIAMDIKLPSSQGGVDLMQEQLAFLRIARSKDAFLKAVIKADTGEEELARACRMLSGEAGDSALVLQPATCVRGEERIAPQRVAELYEVAAAFFADVRVIPQVHRIWGGR